MGHKLAKHCRTLAVCGMLIAAASCGSDSEESDAGESQAAEEAGDEVAEDTAAADQPADTAEAAAEEAPVDSGLGGVVLTGDGTVAFEITGGHEDSGTWTFVPYASYWDGSSWSLTFMDPESAGSIVALQLNPDGYNFSYSNGSGVTIAGSFDQCNFDVEQSENSASGDFDCSGMTAITPTSATDGVSVTGSFSASV